MLVDKITFYHKRIWMNDLDTWQEYYLPPPNELGFVSEFRNKFGKLDKDSSTMKGEGIACQTSLFRIHAMI